MLPRKVWDYKKADWDLLKDSIEEEKWDFLRSLDPNVATVAFTEKLLAYAEASIGRKNVTETKSTHPWMTPEIVQCIADKHASEGTDQEKHLTEICSQTILEARIAFIQSTRAELKSMKHGSNLWWKECQ